MSKDREAIKIVQKNRKAYFNYEIIEKLEAGLVLLGSEVKSIREGNVSIHESYARVRGEEVWVINMDISPYSHAGPLAHEPKRPRKLLLKRTEIRRLTEKTGQKGLTLVPVALYFKGGLAKLEIGLGRGKKQYDKRATMKKREAEREIRKRMMRR